MQHVRQQQSQRLHLGRTPRPTATPRVHRHAIGMIEGEAGPDGSTHLRMPNMMVPEYIREQHKGEEDGARCASEESAGRRRGQIGTSPGGHEYGRERGEDECVASLDDHGRQVHQPDGERLSGGDCRGTRLSNTSVMELHGSVSSTVNLPSWLLEYLTSRGSCEPQPFTPMIWNISMQFCSRHKDERPYVH